MSARMQKMDTSSTQFEDGRSMATESSDPWWRLFKLRRFFPAPGAEPQNARAAFAQKQFFSGAKGAEQGALIWELST